MIKQADLKVDNIKIAGQLHLPDDTSAATPGVILCHGVPSGSVDPADGGYPLLADTISRAGFVVYTFRFRGSGESEGNFDILGWQRDLRAATGYMLSDSPHPVTRLALVGFSAGGTTVICQAAEDPRVKAVVACAAPVDFSAISEADKPQYSLSYFRKIGIIRDETFPPSLPDWLEGFRQVNALKCIASISPRPVLILQSEEDKVVPLENARRLFEKAGQPKQIKVFAGDEHRLRKHAEAVAFMIQWLKSNL